MKKLGKLKLRNCVLLNEQEMKDIRGGYNDNQPTGYECHVNSDNSNCVTPGSGTCMVMGNNGVPLLWGSCNTYKEVGEVPTIVNGQLVYESRYIITCTCK